MSIDIRRAEQTDLTEIVTLDYRNFGVMANPGDDQAVADLLDLDRFLVATDGDQMVAAGGTFQLELTIPGGSTLPISAVTWVSVLASHRRRGILRGLMSGLDELAEEFEEPILGLSASEGPIYERFGYGVSTKCRVIELDRRRAQIDPKWEPEPVRLVNAADHVEEMLACYDRYRLTQPGEVSRSEALFRDQNIEKNRPDFAAIHPDGYAIWEVQPDWNHGHPAHVLTVKDLIAVTPEAHLALWNILLSVDLVGPIRTIRSVAADDALPYLLTDQRALRTVEANDFLWLKVADAARCFEPRSFRTDDRLVVGIVDDELPASGAEPAAPVEVISLGRGGSFQTDDPYDIIAARSALGPLLLGVSAAELEAGRRLRAKTDILERADAMLGVGRTAHCRTSF
ncbi:MAG: GNAT family N-acetyltransferase [Acidimicrobiales bacterium]